MNSTAKLRNMPDLGNCFKTLIKENFIIYKGCTIERHGNTYVWGWAKKCYPNLDAAKQAVDNAAATLANSIKSRA